MGVCARSERLFLENWVSSLIEERFGYWGVFHWIVTVVVRENQFIYNSAISSIYAIPMYCGHRLRVQQ